MKSTNNNNNNNNKGHVATADMLDGEPHDQTETTTIVSVLDDDYDDVEGLPAGGGLDKVYHQQEDNNTHTTAGWSSSGSISSFRGDEEGFQKDVTSEKDYYVFQPEEEEEEAIFDNQQQQQLLLPKTLPAPSGAFKVICLSFLEPDISTCVASTVTEEALRLLQSGGLLYVVDGVAQNGMVPKLPVLRQLGMRRITDDEPAPVPLKVHDIETREILQNHGFTAPTTGPTVTRWIGTKP